MSANILAASESRAFDYGALSTDQANIVKGAEERINDSLKRNVANVIDIGIALRTVKETLPHGQFLPWLDASFGMSKRTAQDYMRVAERFADKCAEVAHLPPSALVLLSSPSTSSRVIHGVVAGEIAPTKRAIVAANKSNQLPKEEKTSPATLLDASPADDADETARDEIADVINSPDSAQASPAATGLLIAADAFLRETPEADRESALLVALSARYGNGAYDVVEPLAALLTEVVTRLMQTVDDEASSIAGGEGGVA